MSKAKNLVWIDLEMTGLTPEIDTIIEIATVITDENLKIIEEGPVLAIHQPESILTSMDEWNTLHHSASGLLDRVRLSTVSMQEAEEVTIDFIQKLTVRGRSPLCGNSIGQDRMFLRRHMPKLEAHMHYRNIDVSSIKELVQRWYPTELHAPAKRNQHLAKDDILESIEELRYYQKRIFIQI